jgi:hypothetical protein
MAMDKNLTQGATVIVRTFGGYPRIRKLWIAGPRGCVVAEDDAWDRLLAGDLLAGAAVPSEDVFRFDPEIAATLNPYVAFDGWCNLTPVLSTLQRGAWASL